MSTRRPHGLTRERAARPSTGEAIANAGSRTSGAPLDTKVRASLEPLLGSDFSNVRVHTDANAAASAQALGATAYTAGNAIAFAPGRYQPNSTEGRKLLTHELAHVAQPGASGATVFSQPGDASERDADHVADTVAAGGSAGPSVAASGMIQRQPLPGMDTLPPLHGSDGLLDNAPPFLAAAVGSTTLDGFDTGKSELKPDHQTQLASTAYNITVLLKQYPLSTIRIIGYADTVGGDEKNLALGETRAAVVKQALVDLGIGEGLMQVSSQGEGAPQAVATKNNTPNVKNRRVEVRFEPKKMNLPSMLPELKWPDPSKQKLPDFSKDPGWVTPPDPFGIKGSPLPPPRPGPLRPDSQQLPPDFWKPIPPLPKGAKPKSVIDIIGEKVIDPVIDKVLGRLSKDLRDKIKDAARSGVAAGVSKSARAFAAANGVTDTEALDAIENATKAGIKMNGGEEQP